MKIHLRQIPAEGLHLEGEEECPIADLAPEDVTATGPLRYALDLGITDGALWANGALSQPVKLRCVRCLEPFPFVIDVKSFALHQDLTGPEVIDLTPFLREDILLNRIATAKAEGSARRKDNPPPRHRRGPKMAGASPIGARSIS